MSVGVIIGRFQTPYLHQGHQKLVEAVYKEHKIATFLVGVRDGPPTANDPLSFLHRRAMILSCYPDALVFPVLDHKSDTIWSENVDRLLATTFGYDAQITIYRGDRGFTGYSGRYKVETLEFSVAITSTQIRDFIIKNPSPSPSFREGIIHAIGTLPARIALSVDMAMFRKGHLDNRNAVEILMGAKEGEDLWRFPGGMVDPNESFAMAAAREMFEETGLITEGHWEILDDFPIDDWRIKGQPGITHKSVLLFAPYSHGGARPQDDLARVRWVNLDASAPANIIPEHREMWEYLQNNTGVFENET